MLYSFARLVASSNSGVPPVDGTLQSPSCQPGTKTIRPSRSQEPPTNPERLRFAGLAKLQMVVGEPPVIGTFFNWLRFPNPTHWLSGEKNGRTAPSEPEMSVASSSCR